MSERAAAEATAFALDRRNFDYLPDDQAARWRSCFISPHRARVLDPRKLIVELLNTCNLDCPICRVGQHGVDLARAMPHPVFERLLESAGGVQTVRLNGLGEATLLPNFSAYVETLARRGLGIELITNGSGRLSDYRRVLMLGGHLLVSWDSADPAVFEQLRRPARWPEYLASLESIAAAAAQTPGRGRCSLIFTLQKNNIGEAAGVVELAAGLGISAVQINVAKLAAPHWHLPRFDAIVADLAAASRSATARGITLFAPDQIGGEELSIAGTTKTAGSRCVAPWQEAVIRWNGDVQTCNMFNPYTYGNIHRAPFGEIWRNRFAALFRGKLNGSDRHPYCVACAYMPSAYD